MKTIPQTYTRDGYNFTLITQNGLIGIYEQRKRDIVRYVTMAFHEKHDCSQVWTYITLAAAQQKMNELVNKKLAAKEAAEAERDRLNAEHRKEQK